MAEGSREAASSPKGPGSKDKRDLVDQMKDLHLSDPLQAASQGRREDEQRLQRGSCGSALRPSW